MENRSLYVHIPFCDTICHYCDFCKVYYDNKQVSLYLEMLEKEIKQTNISSNLETVYIGGGTPSSLNDEQLEKLLEMLKPYTKNCKEYCMEMNPESMDYFKLSLLKRYGVNRLSIGVQTFQDAILKGIDRHHNTTQVKTLIKYAKQLGFNNISIDLMYGLPEQTIEDVKKDLEEVKALDLQHISYYSLILEDNTILKYKNYQPLSEEEDYAYASLIQKELEAMGFYQYEVSNYSIKGYESKHNLAYWHYNNYTGIGLGACSKIDDEIITHSRSLTKYLNGDFKVEVEKQSKEETMFNHLMMSLRLVEGIDLDDFKQRYDVDFLECYKEAIASLLDKGFIKIENNHLTTTKEGFNILNDVLLEFM